MGGSRVLMYFTIQSNLVMAVVCAAGVILTLYGKEGLHAWKIIQFAAMVFISLTGLVFCFVLVPELGPSLWNVQNILTHLVVPAAAIADFFVTGIPGRIRNTDVFYVLLPSLAYAVYAGIGYARGWKFSEGIRYPYFFLNWGSPAGAFGFARSLPFMGCGWWILAILGLLLALGFGYLAILEA